MKSVENQNENHITLTLTQHEYDSMRCLVYVGGLVIAAFETRNKTLNIDPHALSAISANIDPEIHISLKLPPSFDDLMVELGFAHYVYIQ